MPYADIYVLAQERTEVTVSGFLDRFTPLREEAAEKYCIPQYSDAPTAVFQTAVEMDAGSDISYVTSESPPPETAAEFRRIAMVVR